MEFNNSHVTWPKYSTYSPASIRARLQGLARSCLLFLMMMMMMMTNGISKIKSVLTCSLQHNNRTSNESLDPISPLIQYLASCVTTESQNCADSQSVMKQVIMGQAHVIRRRKRTVTMIGSYHILPEVLFRVMGF